MFPKYFYLRTLNMDKEILIELIRIAPTLIWTLLVVLLLLAYRRPI